MPLKNYSAALETPSIGGAAPMEAVAIFLLLLAASLMSACATAVPAVSAPPPVEAGAQRTIHVVRHGLHTGIAVPAADVPDGAWPARRDFSGAEYLEVGWGDRAYYQAPDPDVWLALRALFWPTPGVLHVVGFSGPVERQFPGAEIVELHVSRQGLARLVDYVRASHELDPSGTPIALGRGRHGTSRFYASREEFHLFKTCNVWTAGVLRVAGVSLPSVPALTAGGLISRLRAHGRTIGPAP